MKKIPNAVTLAAIQEPTDLLPRHHTMEDLRAALGI